MQKNHGRWVDDSMKLWIYKYMYKTSMMDWYWFSFKLFNARENIMVDRLTMSKLQNFQCAQKNHGWSVDDSMNLWKCKYAYKTWIMDWQWYSFKLFNARENILVDRLMMSKLQNFQYTWKNYGWSVDNDEASKTLIRAKKSRLISWRLDEYMKMLVRVQNIADGLIMSQLQIV